MMRFILGSFLVFSQTALAGGFLEMRPASKDADALAAFHFTPEIRRAIEAEALKFDSWAYRASQASLKAQAPIRSLPERYVIFSTDKIEKKKPVRPSEDGQVRVFGFTQKEVLAMDGDPNGEACGNRHDQDDLSNRWCHAYFTNQMGAYLRNNGMGPGWAAVLSTSFFLPKEYLYDKNPSMADLMTAEYEFYNTEKNQVTTRMTVTAFMDKAFVVTFQRRFWGF